MVLEAFSVSHGKASAFLPVIDLLHGYFDVRSEDDARKRREKVAGRIVILDRALEERCHIFIACSESRWNPIRWRRWTRKIESGGRSKRSSAS